MSRFNFWLVWAVGLVPVMLAALIYYSGFMMPEQKNHGGELVVGQHIKSWQLPGEETHHWQLLLTAPESCRQQCDRWWAMMDKLHTALGKDRDRVVVERLAPELIVHQQTEHPGAAVWVVDPMGNLVLRYTLDEPPKQVLRDLRRLLKVSRVG
ncbi:hypothetical protein [Neptuniibacter halophilus]|uniref:hypothetical protein n=1 Tax=Neptuniibacter halophilus TaxID=651666 RepID=UPI0025724563|nr:hypothetical protein [Neptuniibacter halophilus]